MEADDTDHDMNPKSILDGVVLPAGQTAVQDLTQGLQTIVNNSSVGPFMCLRLIQQLVMSNPSPAYMTRCSAAFADNGSGARGDLKAVVKEILLDSEPAARRPTSSPQRRQTQGAHPSYLWSPAISERNQRRRQLEQLHLEHEGRSL